MAKKKKAKKKKKKTEKGWDAEDKEEALEAEALKGTQMDVGRVSLYDRDKTTAGIETYDEDTGRLEGQIILKGGSQEGLLALVKITEEVNVEQDHDANINSIGFTGKLSIENPSTIDRLWDIDVALSNIEKTNLDSAQIKIRELGTDESNNADSRDFQITGDVKNLLLVKEYINTLPDADDILTLTDIETDLLKLKEKTSTPAEISSNPISEEDIDTSDYETDTSDDEDVIVLDEEDSEDSEDDEDEIWDDGGVDASEFTLESYGISIDKENLVHFAIAMRSLFDKPISNVKVVKNIPDDFSNITIKDASVGMAQQEGNQIVWTIDELEPETTAMLKFTCIILVSDIQARKTGTIEVSYQAASSFAEGLAIEKFDAYTRNKFYVDTMERDDAPGTWDCKLVFENSSEFIIELFNADVYAPEDESTKLVDIDPSDVPKLPAGAQWHSTIWQYETEGYPSFRKKLEFRVVPDFQTSVNSAIAISDVELSVASILGEVAYDLTQVPTFVSKDVNATLRMLNNGSAPLNEITIIHENFSEEFKAPNPEEITLLLDESQVELAAEAVSIEDGMLKITLKDLKDTSTGMLESESTLELQYPIHCTNPSRDAKFESQITYLANTSPISAELEYTPEVPMIEAVHLRRKFRIGKEVVAIGDLGSYKIILLVENIGEMPLQNLVLMDKVPDSFEYGTYSLQPEITDEVGQDTLKWTLESIEEGEAKEITYEITGTGEYSPSEAQLAL